MMWNILPTFSFLEIYNECINDLLAKNNSQNNVMTRNNSLKGMLRSFLEFVV